MKLVLRGPARVTSAEILLGMSTDNLLSFEHIDSSGSTPEKIKTLEASLVRTFEGHVWHLNTTGQSIENNFMKIDPAGFDEFRISDKWTQLVEMDPNAALTVFSGTPSTASSTTATTNNKNKPSEVFKKEIKRDPSLFSVLKGNKAWDS